MKLDLGNMAHCARMSSAVLLCGLVAVGCGKKQNETDADKESNNTEVVDNEFENNDDVSNASLNNTALTCDDPVALSKLNQSVQSAVSSRASNLFRGYAQRSGNRFSIQSTNTAVESILIDIANPTTLQEANAQGTVTCHANLSLTLPNKDVRRASQIYNNIEGGSLSSRLESDNVTLNNNMLVSKNFNYVVSLQGGQATARMVGEPVIIAAASDIIAKSQFQAALDANRSRPQTRDQYSGSSTSQSQSPSNQSRNDAVQTPRPAPAPLPAPPARVENPNNDNQSSNRPEESTAKPNQSESDESASTQKPNNVQQNQNQDSDLSVPQDDSIDMVIIEEEGTY